VSKHTIIHPGLILTLALMPLWPLCSSAETTPNILVLMADDLGWNDVGYHGSEILTPEIDKLAAKSLKLEQFYVFPWCTATRAAFESGINPIRFGLRSLEHNFDGAALPDRLDTIASFLGQRGYYTALLGKWHLSMDFAGGPLDKGYREAFGYLHGQIDHETHEDHHGVASLFRDTRLIEAEGHMTDLIFQELQRLVDSAEPPFFVNVTFSAPHYPLQAPERYVAANAHVEHPDRRLYAAMVTHMDDVIGKILTLLEHRGLLQNTIVVFLSDNGGHPQRAKSSGYYGGDGRDGPYEVMADNRPLRGGKTEVYEGGIRVPAFIHYPTKLKAGTYAGFLSVLDLLPTLLDFAGGESPPGRDGRSIRRQLIDGNVDRATEFYWITSSEKIPHGGGNQAAVRIGDWKLVESQRRFFWLPWRIEWPWPKYELFDLRTDPNELADLYDEKPEQALALRKKLDRFLSEEFGQY